MTPNRPEHADRDYRIDDRFSVRRHLSGYAYPANGNVHNPTPRYVWLLLLDGRPVDHGDTKRELVAASREYGVAGYGLVRPASTTEEQNR